VAARLTPERRRLLDHLLDQVLELEPDQRGPFIEQCRRRAPRLSVWLERLLRAMDAPSDMFENSARHLIGEALEAREGAGGEPLVCGSRLGPWRVIESIGVGGMGEVYRGERADGTFDMQVAIKVIRRSSDQLAELLEAERNVMARINHPAIARLLDGGLTEDDRPYLVMEWVDGPTLADWLADVDPDPDRMLEVFRDACTAVSAAHRQLVVHGDIKPSNLIVTSEGQVRLLDFGVAKLLDAGAGLELSDALTPGFSAPEQMAAEPISTASDIYSLGAMLHWMVFGCAPGRGGKPLPAWQSYHRLSDLVAIIERATAVEPDLRYPTVNGLLLEVQRLRQHFPVRARKASPMQQLGLWVRRHRTGAVLGSIALASVLIGVSVTVWQVRVVALERDLAQTEAALSEAVREHLLFLFREVGGLADDTGALTARELLDQTAEVAEDWLSEDPMVQQQVLAVLGEIMIALHDYSSAEPLLAGFIEYQDDQVSPVLRSMALRDLAQVYHRQGRMEEGFEVIDEALNILQRFPGHHPARESDILQIRGRLHRDLGRWDQALADLERARELAVETSPGPWPLMARAENNLGTTLLMGGRLQDAARHFEAAEALWFAMNRGESNDALSVTSNLALTLDRLGRSQEAERRLRRVVDIRERNYGDSGAMAASRLHLGRLLTVLGKYDEAAEHLYSARDVARRYVGEDTPDHGAALIGLGELAFARGELEEALEWFGESARIMSGRLGKGHPFTLQAALEVNNARVRLEDDADDSGYRSVIEQARAVGPAGRTVLSAALCDFSAWAIEHGRHAEAGETAAECLALREQLALGGWRVAEPRVLMQLAAVLDEDERGDPAALRDSMRDLIEQTHADRYLVRLGSSAVGERLTLGDPDA
jgi:eukaryotic-like serine/threonine-protein kinase